MSNTLIRIKALRKEKDLSITDFAASIGIHRQRIQDIEAGKVKKVQQDILLKCSEVYGVSLNWLMTGDGEMYAKADAPKAGAMQYVMVEKNQLDNLVQEVACLPELLKEVSYLRKEIKEIKSAMLEAAH